MNPPVIITTDATPDAETNAASTLRRVIIAWPHITPLNRMQIAAVAEAAAIRLRVAEQAKD